MSKRRRRRQRVPQDIIEASIESLSAEGRGVARVEGKTVFVDNALVGETVKFQYTKTSSKFDEARAIEILTASADRAEPACEHYGVCGGCSLMHMQPAAQIKHKQQTLLDLFKYQANVTPAEVIEPLTGPVWAYRYKARLGVKYVAKKEKVLVGFREKNAPYIANLNSCKVLHESVGEKLLALGDLIMGMEARQTIPQIEVSVSDAGTALTVRHLKPLSDSDKNSWIEFAKQNDMQIYLQSGGPKTVEILWPENPQPLFYELSQQDVKIEFQPLDFTQVNPVINEQMLAQTLAFLDLNKEEKVLDLFCGLGNFTLPMARLAKHVVGVEGVEVMVAKARENARLNGIENTEFFAADLSADLATMPWLMNQQYDKILLDPPRSGAMEMLKYLGQLKAKRIVYVSCHPSTLARDAQVLVQEYGYTLSKAGVMDMFPHTAHVESIAVFDKP